MGIILWIRSKRLGNRKLYTSLEFAEFYQNLPKILRCFPISCGKWWVNLLLNCKLLRKFLVFLISCGKWWGQSFVELQTSPKLPGKSWFFSGNYAPLEILNHAIFRNSGSRIYQEEETPSWHFSKRGGLESLVSIQLLSRSFFMFYSSVTWIFWIGTHPVGVKCADLFPGVLNYSAEANFSA